MHRRRTTRCARWNTSASPCRTTCPNSRPRRSTAATRAAACRSGCRSRDAASTTSACCRWRAPSRSFAANSGPGRNRRRPRRPMWTDPLGNAVTLHDGSGLAAVDDFVQGLIASEARAVNVLAAAADDESAIVQAYAAAVHMFAESRDAASNARPYIERAKAAECDEREGRFIAAIDAWVDGDTARAIRLHE